MKFDLPGLDRGRADEQVVLGSTLGVELLARVEDSSIDDVPCADPVAELSGPVAVESRLLLCGEDLLYLRVLNVDDDHARVDEIRLRTSDDRAECTRVAMPTGEVTGEVRRLLTALAAEPASRKALQAALKLRHEDHFRNAYLIPALAQHLIEMTIPEKPNSRLQKYRLTPAGRATLAKVQGG